MSYKLLIEKTDPQEFEYILEEKNTKEAPRLYIKGPYMMADGCCQVNVGAASPTAKVPSM